MAIGSLGNILQGTSQTNQGLQAAQAMMSARNQQLMQAGGGAPVKPPAGSLILHDSFDPGSPPPELGLMPPPFQSKVTAQSPHGEQVRHAAQADGFSGPGIEHMQMDNPDYHNLDVAEARLTGGPLSKEDARQALNYYMASDASSLLNDQARALNENADQGVTNSVSNLSLGTSKASIVENLYATPFGILKSKDPEQVRMAENMIKNQATAFELDSSKLLSEDPKVHGPERQLLQQGLIDRTSHVIDTSTTVASARANFDKAVDRFEGQNNSVVIAAGNEGQVRERLEAMNHGLPLKTPADFSKNVLENDAVTSVGATRWREKDGELSESRARYSSNSEGVDIYASGSLGFQDSTKAETFGTSVAAPRVAAAMTELHKLNPSMSSSQVESLMKQRLTHSLNTGNGDIQVLDYSKNFEFLKNGRY